VKVLTNLPDKTLIRGVASLLVRTIAATPGDLFLVSPWLKDVRLPTAAIGSFRAALGGDPDEVPLVEILERAARRHRLHLVTKPPGELVDLELLKRIADKQRSRLRLTENLDLTGMDIIEELTGGIDADIRALAASASKHADTLRISQQLHVVGAKVSYLDKLRAKVLWTPLGAIVGSANFTNGGLLSNEELMLEVTDAAAHAALGDAVRAIVGRAVPSSSYRLRDRLSEWKLVTADLACPGEKPLPADPLLLTEVMRLLTPFI
jgi:phosphatidylserine/phosphatidylglycerophosphate/cardiolipin synthase-like enzyme